MQGWVGQQWQTVDALQQMTKRQLIDRIRGSDKGNNSLRDPKNTKHASWHRGNRGHTYQHQTLSQSNPTWFCSECGTSHNNPKATRCRECKSQRTGYEPPPPKLHPINTPAVQSVLAQLRIIEKDTADLAAGAEADEAMESQDVPEQDIQTFPSHEEEIAQLQQVLSSMEGLRMSAGATAGVKARLAELQALTSPQTSLASSITLRTALKHTRDMNDKADKEEVKSIEAAQEALRKAQARLDAAKAKRDIRIANFCKEEQKLLAAVDKAEADKAPQALHSAAAATPAQLPSNISNAEILDHVVALSRTAEGRAALTMRGFSTTPQHVGRDSEPPPTQEGAQDPSELEIEHLIATLPTNLHARLAKRLTQPGVQEKQEAAATTAASAAAAVAATATQQRSAAEIERESAAARESRRASSRSPRRGGEIP